MKLGTIGVLYQVGDRVEVDVTVGRAAKVDGSDVDLSASTAVKSSKGVLSSSLGRGDQPLTLFRNLFHESRHFADQSGGFVVLVVASV